jgi:hypothetical protein
VPSIWHPRGSGTHSCQLIEHRSYKQGDVERFAELKVEPEVVRTLQLDIGREGNDGILESD